MLRVYGALPWTYESGRDPEVLSSFNGFGNFMYVSRHKGKVNEEWRDIFKDVITNDPGLKIFKTYYCVGTGDVFYLGTLQIENIRFWEREKSKNQTTMDNKINERDDTNALKDACSTALVTAMNECQENETTRTSNWQIYEDACKRFESHKQALRESSEESKQIAQFQSKINHTKTKIHSMAIRFETAYGVNLDPQFKADQQLLKKKTNELSKSWKQTASNLGHAKCRKKVIAKMGRLGKAYVAVGEVCSTMEEPCCCTLHSPGLNYLKTCPRCKTTSVRDESGRAIGKRAVLSCGVLTMEFKNKSDHLNGQIITESNGLVPTVNEFW